MNTSGVMIDKSGLAAITNRRFPRELWRSWDYEIKVGPHLGPAFRLNWTSLDYDIWLYSHLISMLGTPGQLLESRQVSERKIICEALTCVIRQIKYDYNPNRRGALARFIEKASPSELHKGKSRQILNTKKASLKPDAKHPKPRLAVL